MNRAYSILEIKDVDDERRIITGIASTPTPDRMADIVKPEGAIYKLPLPLLWQHDSWNPIGHVTKAKVTKKGIEIVAEIAKDVSDEIERAWKLIKAGLVRGLSIGFRGIDEDPIPNSWGIIYNTWEWLELSAVTIPANEEATITSVKKFDTKAPAASGKKVQVKNVQPAASGKSINPELKDKTMSKNIGAQIAALEATRKEKATALQAIQDKVAAEGRSKNEDEREQFDTLRAELKTIVAEIEDLKDIEAFSVAPTAKAVPPEAGRTTATVAAQPKKTQEKGVLFAQLVKVKAVARLESESKLLVAEKMYGKDSDVFGLIKAGEVLPATATSGNWGYDLISPEGAAVADFVELLRAGTITGKFGMEGIPALRSIGFYEPYVIQTGDGVGYWVGEAKPIPMTSFDFDRSTLTPLKLGSIVGITERNIRYSSPKSDITVRDQLIKVLTATEDTAFIDPSNNGEAGAKPISVTYGAETVASTGDEAEDVRLDLRALIKKFTDAHNPARQGVFVMSSDNAVALGTMTNALGQAEFPTVNMNGGTLMGLPVIVSDYASSNVTLLNASDIYYADEGGVAVDVSREASLEMKNQANITQNGGAGTGASLVSLWQHDMIGVRALKTVNWKLRRATAVAYLTGVTWGGAVPAS